MKFRFTNQEITFILEQAIIYTCACPAQICKAINEQRALYKYQQNCLNVTDTDRAVHQLISETVISTHAQLEHCLEQILLLEGWDMETYQMPKAMQKKLLSEIETTLDNTTLK